MEQVLEFTSRKLFRTIFVVGGVRKALHSCTLYIVSSMDLFQWLTYFGDPKNYVNIF